MLFFTQFKFHKILGNQKVLWPKKGKQSKQADNQCGFVNFLILTWNSTNNNKKHGEMLIL